MSGPLNAKVQSEVDSFFSDSPQAVTSTSAPNPQQEVDDFFSDIPSGSSVDQEVSFFFRPTAPSTPSTIPAQISNQDFYKKVDSLGVSPPVTADPSLSSVSYKDPTVGLQDVVQDLLPASQRPETISPVPSRTPFIDVPVSFIGGLANNLTGRLFDRSAVVPGSGADQVLSNSVISEVQRFFSPQSEAGRIAQAPGDFLGAIGGFLLNPAASGVARGRANLQQQENQDFMSGRPDKGLQIAQNKVPLAALSGATDWLLGKIPGHLGKSLLSRVSSGAGLGAVLGPLQGRVENATLGRETTLQDDLANAGLNAALGAAGGAAPEIAAGIRKVFRRPPSAVEQQLASALPIGQSLPELRLSPQQMQRLGTLNSALDRFKDILERAPRQETKQRALANIQKIEAEKESLLSGSVRASKRVENTPQVSQAPPEVSEAPKSSSDAPRQKALPELDTLFENRSDDITSELTKNQGQSTKKTGRRDSTFLRSEKTAPEVKEKVTDEDLSYDIKSNEDGIQQARAYIAEYGLDKAEEFAATGNSYESDAVGIELVRQLQQAEKYEAAIRVVNRLVDSGTDVAQRLQLRRLWDVMTPEGAIKYASAAVRKAQEDKIKDPVLRAFLDPDFVKAQIKEIKKITSDHADAVADAVMEKMKKLRNC